MAVIKEATLQYIKDANRTLTAFRSSGGKIHVASTGLNNTDPRPVVPPLTAAEAKAFATRLLELACDLEDAGR